jgi:hypothetical protein
MHRTNQMETVPIRIDRVVNSRLQEVDFATVVFGSVFSDHMFTAEFQDGRWSEGLIRPYGPIPLAPNISALQYGVSVFEGMKAHQSADGRPLLFRARENARRLQRSAARLAMPAVPESLFLDGLRELVRLDQAWIPPAEMGALYIRPIDTSSSSLPLLLAHISRRRSTCWSVSVTCARFREEPATQNLPATTPLRSWQTRKPVTPDATR